MAKISLKPSKAEKFKAGLPGVTTKREGSVLFLKTAGVVLLVLSVFGGIFIGLLGRDGLGPPSYQDPRNVIQYFAGEGFTIDVLAQLAIASGVTVVIAFVCLLIYHNLRR